MKEVTLAFVKPDAFKHRKEIRARYLEKGLEIVAEKQLKMDRRLAEKFYGEHRGSPHFEPNILHNVSGRIWAMIIHGENAIARVRRINGATDPDKAEPGTIRWDYGTHNVGPINPRNAVHSSDSEASAEREIDLFFGTGAYERFKKYCGSV